MLGTIGTVAASASVVGCLGDDGDSGADVPAMDSGSPTYREWMPAEQADIHVGGWQVTNLDRLRAVREDLTEVAYGHRAKFVEWGDYFGVPVADVEYVISALTAPEVIYAGSFDRSTVETALPDIGYTRQRIDGDVTFYRGPDGPEPGRFAVGEAGVVHHPSGGDTVWEDTAIAFLEAAAGERPRRYESSTAFEAFTDDVGWPLSVHRLDPPVEVEPAIGESRVVPEAVEDDVLQGRAAVVDDGDIVSVYWLWPIEDGSTSPGELHEEVRDMDYGHLTDGGGEIGIERRGRATVLAVHESLSGARGGRREPRLFSVSASFEDGTLVVRHHGGDPVPGDRIVAVADGGRHEPLSSLEPGDSVTVPTITAAASGSVEVRYESFENTEPLIATA